LIIISVMLLAGVSWCLYDWSMNQRKLYEANVEEILVVHKDHYDPLNICINPGKVLRFPKGTKDDVIKQTIRRDFPNMNVNDYFVFDSAQGRNIGASYDDKGRRVFNNIFYKTDFDFVSAFFLIFFYPLYLLVRFVVWAIVTLKEKSEN